MNSANADLVVVIATTLLLGSIAVAQSTDWQVLKTIPGGTKIRLQLKHSHTFGHCKLADVTDDTLACNWRALGNRRYARDEIREVRLGNRTVRAGFLIGAGTGAIVGVAKESTGNAGRVFNVIVLTPVLGCVGAGVGALVDPFRADKPLYISPHSSAEPAEEWGNHRLQPTPNHPELVSKR